MKMFESRASFELSVILTNAEALLYYEVFRNKMSLKIPELGNKKFAIIEMEPYSGEGTPENSWHLVIKQEATERIVDPTTSNALDNPSPEENGANNEH
jgi:hypothetical protein